MKERPILFSGQMVRAILAGTKTQTRRIVKPQPRTDQLMPENWSEVIKYNPNAVHGDGLGWVALDESGEHHEFRCPYGTVSDRLWARETYYAYGRWETRFSTKKGRDEWHFIDLTVEMDRLYQFDTQHIGEIASVPRNHGGVTPTWWKRPAIFMPRSACRIELEVTSVRVERLQDISYEDAIAEGIINPATVPPFPHQSTETVEQFARRTKYPQRSYASLWEEINGLGSWDANPWVWCITFKRIK